LFRSLIWLALLWQTPSAQARGKKRNGKAASEVFYFVAAKDKKFARRYEESWGRGDLSARDGADKSVSN